MCSLAILAAWKLKGLPGFLHCVCSVAFLSVATLQMTTFNWVWIKQRVAPGGLPSITLTAGRLFFLFSCWQSVFLSDCLKSELMKNNNRGRKKHFHPMVIHIKYEHNGWSLYLHWPLNVFSLTDVTLSSACSYKPCFSSTTLLHCKTSEYTVPE